MKSYYSIVKRLKGEILPLKLDWLVLGLLVGGLVFRGIVAFWLYPGFDEAYYFLYSQHLDWSYFDHPLLVALITGFGPWLTGIVSHFTIRLGTLILYTGSLVLLYLTSAKLFDSKVARLTLAIATIIPIFQIGFGVLTLPEIPLIFFWTASLYCAVSEFFSQPVNPASNQFHPLTPSPRLCLKNYRPSYRLAILGVLLGLTCLGKYHGFILALGLVGFCLTSPHHRRAFLSPWMWLGISLFFITLFPLWFWNWQHDWVSFRFQLSSRFEPEPGVPPRSYSFLNIAIVFLSGIAYLFPTMGLPLWWVTVRSLLLGKSQETGGRKAFPIQNPQSKIQNPNENILFKQRFILWISLPLIIGFTLLGGWQQILPGWPMPGFWGLTLLLGQYAAYWQKYSRRWVRRWLVGSGITVTTLLLLILLHVTTGTLQKPSQFAWFGGFLAPESDPSTELIDIRQLRQGFVTSPVLLTALQNSRFVFTNAYYLGGLIDMALHPLTSIPVTCFSEDRRGFAFWSDSEQWLGENALYVTLKRFQQMPKLNQEFSSYFHSFQEIGTIPIRRGGTVTEVFYVYQGKTMLKPYNRGVNFSTRQP